MYLFCHSCNYFSRVMRLFSLGAQNGLPVKIKEEPAEQVDTEERQIVLDIGSHLVDHDESTHDSIVDPYQFQFDSSANMSDSDIRLGSNGSYRCVSYKTYLAYLFN